MIDSLVKRRVAGAGVNGHVNVLGSWIRLSEQSSVWRCEIRTGAEESNIRRRQVRCRTIDFNSEWEGLQSGEHARGNSSRSLRPFRDECDKGSFGIKATPKISGNQSWVAT